MEILISKHKLEFLHSEYNQQYLLTSDCSVFRAWFLHHLGIEPKVCGLSEDYYRTHVHLPDNNIEGPIVNPPLNTTSWTSILQRSIDVYGHIPGRPSEGLLGVAAKRQKLAWMQRTVRSKGRGQPATNPLHTTAVASPALSTPADVPTVAAVEQTALIASRPSKRPREEDTVPRERHDAIVKALKDEIQSLRENEVRILSLGLSWRSERDKLRERLERVS